MLSTKDYWPSFFFLPVCVFGLFFPVISNTYLFHDDYINFQPGSGRCPFSPISIDWYINMGRPLAGWTLCGYSKFIHSPDDGSFVRFFGLVTIVIMTALLYTFMIRCNVKPFKATLLAALSITVPAVAIYAFWFTVSFVSIGIIFSITSGLIIYRVLEEKIHGWKKIVLIITSIGFFIAAILTYQPSSMVYWGLLAFSLWHWVLENDLSWMKKSISMASLGIISMGLYGLWYIPNNYQNLKVLDPSRSMHSLTSTLSKFHEFTLLTMPTINKIWFENPFPWFSWVFLGIILVGIVVAKLSFKKKAVLFLMYPVLCIFSFFPVLVSNFPETIFRTMFPTWIVTIAYFSGALTSLNIIFKQRFRIEEILLMFFLVVGIVLQFHFISDRLVKPSAFELSFIKGKIALALNRNPSIKSIILCPLHYRLISPIYSDEYGSPTAAFNQDIPSLIGSVLRKNYSVKNIPLVWKSTCQVDTGADNIILDLTDMLKSKLWPSMLATPLEP